MDSQKYKNCYINREIILKLIKHNYKELIEKIIEEIKGKLEVKPEIIVFGKVCNQNRNIAFYSNDSIGYHYSNRLLRSKTINS